MKMSYYLLMPAQEGLGACLLQGDQPCSSPYIKFTEKCWVKLRSNRKRNVCDVFDTSKFHQYINGKTVRELRNTPIPGVGLNSVSHSAAKMGRRRRSIIPIKNTTPEKRVLKEKHCKFRRSILIEAASPLNH